MQICKLENNFFKEPYARIKIEIRSDNMNSSENGDVEQVRTQKMKSYHDGAEEFFGDSSGRQPKTQVKTLRGADSWEIL